MRNRLLILTVWLLFVLSGCQPIELSPEITFASPDQIRLSIPTSLETIGPVFDQCGEKLQGTTMILEYGQSHDSSDYTARVDWGFNPHKGKGFPIAKEHIVLITHPGWIENELGIETIKSIYLDHPNRSNQSPTHFSGIAPWSYPVGDPLREIFTIRILQSDRLVRHTSITPDPAAMLEAVSTQPNSIGYLPNSWTETMPPSQMVRILDEHRVELDVVLFASPPLQRTLYNLIVCLQSNEGQTGFIQQGLAPFSNGIE